MSEETSTEFSGATLEVGEGRAYYLNARVDGEDQDTFLFSSLTRNRTLDKLVSASRYPIPFSQRPLNQQVYTVALILLNFAVAFTVLEVAIHIFPFFVGLSVVMIVNCALFMLLHFVFKRPTFEPFPLLYPVNVDSALQKQYGFDASARANAFRTELLQASMRDEGVSIAELDHDKPVEHVLAQEFKTYLSVTAMGKLSREMELLNGLIINRLTSIVLLSRDMNAVRLTVESLGGHPQDNSLLASMSKDMDKIVREVDSFMALRASKVDQEN